MAAGLLIVLAACAPGYGPVAATPVSEPTPSPSPSPTAIASPAPLPSPSPYPSPSPSLYVEVQNDDYGHVSVTTVAGARCIARAILPDGSDAPGLPNPQIADAAGVATWRYPSDDDFNGFAEHYVTCTLNGISGSAYAYFTTNG